MPLKPPARPLPARKKPRLPTPSDSEDDDDVPLATLVKKELQTRQQRIAGSRKGVEQKSDVQSRLVDPTQTDPIQYELDVNHIMDTETALGEDVQNTGVRSINANERMFSTAEKERTSSMVVRLSNHATNGNGDQKRTKSPVLDHQSIKEVTAPTQTIKQGKETSNKRRKDKGNSQGQQGNKRSRNVTHGRPTAREKLGGKSDHRSLENKGECDEAPAPRGIDVQIDPDESGKKKR